MPLVKQQLASALTKALSPNQKISSAKTQAFNIAKAYSDYAQNALSPAGGTVDPSTKAVKLRTLATALEGVFKTKKGGSAVANGMGTAFSAFWLLPPTVFIAVPPGAVTAAIPASLIKALIGSASKKDTVKKASEKLASNLHTWTTTAVIVTHLPVPPGPVGPLT